MNREEALNRDNWMNTAGWATSFSELKLLKHIDKILDEHEVQLHELKKGQASKLALMYQQGGAVMKKEFEGRTCESCKLQYDKWCPISETNHDFKYCSEWEKKS